MVGRRCLVSERIIPADRSVIIAADVEPKFFLHLVEQTTGIREVGAYKIGFEVGLGMGLSRAIDLVRRCNDLHEADTKVIYDHQKAGTDIPDTAENFARTMAASDVDAAILFPFAGPDTEERWIDELQKAEIGVIVGAEMTHPNISGEFGYVRDDAFERMFSQAVELGVTDFVVPGNKPDRVTHYREFFESALGEGNFSLYAPGFVAQGGEVSEAGKAAGRNWHAIIGRGITQAADVRVAAIEHTRQVRTAGGRYWDGH